VKTGAKASENTRRNFVAKNAQSSGAGFHSSPKDFDRKSAKSEIKAGIKYHADVKSGVGE